MTSQRMREPGDRVSKILYVAGPGRSGSTLLDMLLGQVDGFCSTGELRFIWDRGFGQNQLCGCGKPFRECKFWTEVVGEAFGGFQNVDHQRLERLRSSAEKSVSNGFYPDTAPDQMTPYAEYYEGCRRIYGAVSKISGCEFIVDSSKNIANGFLLSQMPGIDLFTIHLVRDSRAVAYSWQRKKVRPEILGEPRLMSQRRIVKSALRWNSRNGLAHKLESVSKKYALLRYEDLARQPGESLSNLLADLGLELPSLDFLDGFLAKLGTNHTVSGNPVRFAQNEIRIQQDLQWQTDMAIYKRWLVTFLTWPLLLKYGYLRKDSSRKKAG